MTRPLWARHFGLSAHWPLRSPMASSALPSRTIHRRVLPPSAPSHPSRETFAPGCLPGAVSRRRAAVQILSAGFLTSVAPPPPSLAARRGRIVVPPEDYATARTSVCLLPAAVAFCICSQFLAKVAPLIFFLNAKLAPLFAIEFQLITAFCC